MFYLGSRYRVEKPSYVAEYDQNKDGVCDEQDWQGWSLEQINTATMAIHDSFIVDETIKPRQITGENILLGMPYDKKTKVHECVIERVSK